MTPIGVVVIDRIGDAVFVGAGHLPPAEENGVAYLRIPLNVL